MRSLNAPARVLLALSVMALAACRPSAPDTDTPDEVAASGEGSAATAEAGNEVTDDEAAALPTTGDDPPAEPDDAPVRIASLDDGDVCSALRRDLLGPSGAPIESIDLAAARDAIARGGEDRNEVLDRLLGGGAEAGALVADLTPLLDDGDTGTRRAAWAALAASDPATLVETARPLLRDPNAQATTRDEAARALAMTGRAGLAALTSAAREDDPTLRAIARSGLRTSLSWPLAARDVLFADDGWCAELGDPVCVELARAIAQADPDWLARRAVGSARFSVVALEYAALTDADAGVAWEQTILASDLEPAERVDSARILSGYGHAHAAARVAAHALSTGLEADADRRTAGRIVLDGAGGLGDDADHLVAFAEAGGAGSLFAAAALYRATGSVHAAPQHVLEAIATPSHSEREVAIALAATVGVVGFDVATAPLADDERAFATALVDRDAEALVRMAPRMAHQHLVDRGLELYLARDDQSTRLTALITALDEDESAADRWLALGAALGDAGAPLADAVMGRELDRIPDAATARWWDARGGRDALAAAVDAGLSGGHLATRRRALIVAGVLGISLETDRLLGVLTAGAHAIQVETGDLRRLAAGLLARGGQVEPADALALRQRFRPGMPGHTPAGLVALSALSTCDE